MILFNSVDIRFIPGEIVEGPKVILNLPFGDKGLQVSETVVTTWFLMLFFIIVFRWGTKKLEMMPSKKQSIFEIIYNFYDWLAGNVMKHWKDKFLAYIAALISFICLSNILPFFPIPVVNFFEMEGNKLFGIAPAFRCPTADLNTTLGLGFLTAFLFVYNGIRAHGFFGYIKEFMEPSPIMLPIHLIGEIAKPFAIAMRLFGNMLGGGIIMALMYMFASSVRIGGIAPLTVLVAPLHLYFDIFIGFVQSFIFTMLTMVFISSAIGHAEPEGYVHTHD